MRRCALAERPVDGGAAGGWQPVGRVGSGVGSVGGAGGVGGRGGRRSSITLVGTRVEANSESRGRAGVGRGGGARGGAGGDGAVVVAAASGGGTRGGGAIVEPAADGGARRLGRRGSSAGSASSSSSWRDEVAGLGELVEIDLAAADQVEHDLAELGERVVRGGGWRARRRGERDLRARRARGRRAPTSRASCGAACRGCRAAREGGSRRVACRAMAVSVAIWATVGVLVTLAQPGSSAWLQRSAACPPPEPPAAPIPPVSTGKVRVRVFTEPSPVRLLAPRGAVRVRRDRGLDLERWDDEGGVLALSADHGLSGEHVVALAPDPERTVAVDPDRGRARSLRRAGPRSTPRCRRRRRRSGIDFAALAKEATASVAPADDGGVWLGTSHGPGVRERARAAGRRRRSRIRSARWCAIARAGCGSRRRAA